MQKRKPLILALLLLGLLLVACGEAEPAEVTRIVEVEGETITEMVEVTRIVEGETITEQVEVTRIVEVEIEAPAELELVTLVARCRAKPPTEDWRCNNLLDAVADVNADLEAAGDSRRVVVETIQDNTGFGDIMQEFALSYADGQAPDILLTGHEFIGTEATAGRIIKAEDIPGEFRADHPEFDNVIDALWDSVTFQDQIWGIPQDVETRPVYWDKTLLVQVPGWDEARVEGLADEIKAGNFTLDDLLDTAEAAVAGGVVEPGMGFWMRPSNGPDFTALYYAYGGETIDADTGALVTDPDTESPAWLRAAARRRPASGQSRGSGC